MRRWTLARGVPVGLVAAGMLLAVARFPQAQRGVADTEWRHFSGDQQSNKYSPLALINKDNVQNLQVAWRWTSPDRAIEPLNPLWRVSKYEDTPLVIKGVLYTITTLGIVAAIDPAIGATRWTYDPESYKSMTARPANGNFSNRGMEYWTDGRAERLFIGTIDAYLLSIDVTTGKPDPNVGTGGKIDLTTGIRNSVRGTNFVARRPTAAGDVLIVGSAISDAVSGIDTGPPGYVQAYEVRCRTPRPASTGAPPPPRNSVCFGSAV